MEKKLNELVYKWADNNNIDIAFTEWNLNFGTGVIFVKNSEVYYSSLRELNRIMKKHNYYLWTIDKSDCIDEKVNLNIWIKKIPLTGDSLFTLTYE